jgi:Transglutaminase-like superfamily
MALVPRSKLGSRVTRLLALLAVVAVAWLAGSRAFHLAPWAFASQAARVAATPVADSLYRSDVAQSAAIAAGYRVGMQPPAGTSSLASWQSAVGRIPGLELENPSGLVELNGRIPFVYETSSAQFLSAFRQTYHLDEVVKGAATEYDAMLKLAAWAGTRFDHGTDPVPGGNQVCDPSAVIAAGQSGSRYWCEIAARVMVHAANSLGWQARIITGSRDGYTWEHAVAELWSNQFDKWIAIDTDFNVIYEEAGVPLSAFELSARGEKLDQEHRLTVREIAPVKPSLPRKDLMPYYAYVHVDLRTDWCTRPLRAGSPAGGDQSTWWVARPTLPRILTAKVRVDDPAKFDWHVNAVALYALEARPVAGGAAQITTALSGYSPAFDHFEVSLDDAPWQRIDAAKYEAHFAPGEHTLRARLVTRAGYPGPASHVDLRLVAAPAG